MQTELDAINSWYIESVVYRDVWLEVHVVEGIVGDPTDLKISDKTTISGIRPVEILPNSRRFIVRFDKPIAFQIVDESFIQLDEYEVRDDGKVIKILERSKYLDYVNGSHGWYRDMIGPAEHYRVCTYNEVVDVISCTVPIVNRA